MIVKLLRNYCNYFSSFNKNPYQSLGIDRLASQQQVKQAYYKLAKVYHPDIASNNAQTAQTFRDITQAYKILKDPIKRKQFDRIQDSQGRFHENIKMNQYSSDYRRQSKQDVRQEYPEYQMNIKRTFNRDFLRRRTSFNQQAYSHFYFYQRKQVRYMSFMVFAFLQILGLIYGIKIYQKLNQAAQIEKQLEHYGYFEGDFEEENQDDYY